MRKRREGGGDGFSFDYFTYFIYFADIFYTYTYTYACVPSVLLFFGWLPGLWEKGGEESRGCAYFMVDHEKMKPEQMEANDKCSYMIRLLI